MNGKELRNLRESAGLSQSALALKLGYLSKGEPNRSMVSRLENGHANINPRLAQLLRVILGS